MKTITINVENATETQMIWLRNLLEEEINEARGAASNEELWSKGSDTEEQRWQHDENRKENLDYADMLEDALKQMPENFHIYKKGELMITAREMSNLAFRSGRKEHERKAYAYFDGQIRAAARQGKRKMFFGFNGGYMDNEADRFVTSKETNISREDGKKHYAELGFTFEHVGVIGGVMQDADQEYICW